MRSARWSKVSLVVLALGLLVGVQARSEALPAIQNVLGVYNGFSHSSLAGGRSGELQIVIDRQTGRRLWGNVTSPGELLPAVMPIQGTISGNGEFELSGRTGSPRAGDGSVRLLCDGSVRSLGDGSARVMAGYRTWLNPGPPSLPGTAASIGSGPPIRDRGRLLLLRDFGLRQAESVLGTWMQPGPPNDDGSTGLPAVQLGVTEQDGSFFRGRLTLGDSPVGANPGPPIVEFDVVGTVGIGGDPAIAPTGAPIHLIGLGPEGWFLGDGTVQKPPSPNLPAVQCQYQIMLFDGTRSDGTFELVPAV